jgi:hypothetical protein
MKQNHTVTCLLFVSGILPLFMGRETKSRQSEDNKSLLCSAYGGICQHSACNTGLSTHLTERLISMLIQLSDKSR